MLKINSSASRFWEYAGLFILSSAVLHLEMVQMRIFSFSLWHHLAYLVITIAMLGFGAAGTLAAIFPTQFAGPNYPRIVVSGSVIFAISTLLAFLFTANARLDTFQLLTPSGVQFSQLLLLFGYYAIFTIPFMAAGCVISAVFMKYSQRSYGMYFVNLTGSSLGIVLFTWAISRYGGERSLFIGSILAVIAAGCFSAAAKSWKLLCTTIILIAVLCFTGWKYSAFWEPVPAPSKAYGMYLDTLSDFRRVYSRWNPISRIDVIASNECMLPWWEKDKTYSPHMALTIDGDATTWLWHFDRHSEAVCDIRDELYSSAYHTKHQPDVLIIGVGGGNDIRTALHYGAKRIVCAEINPLIIDVISSEFSDFVDNIAYMPGVEIHAAEGRSFIRRTQDQFDIIQMSGVDTWSGLSSGAYVLSENYLYTINAFKDYYSRLNPDGILAVSRWGFDPPREMLRMVAVGADAFEESGIANPWDHILVLSSEYFCSTLFKKSPWTQKEIALYTWYLKDHDKFQIKYSPGMNQDNPFCNLMNAYEQGTKAAFFESYLYDIRPVYDNSPFFFDYYKWSQLPNQIFSSGTGGQIGANWPIAMVLLLAMLFQSAILTGLFIFYPLNRFRNAGLHLPEAPSFISYFVCLGIGYIFVEIVFMQKLVLYLGHPLYSISVVLAGLLFFSGLGSLSALVMPYRKIAFLPVVLLSLAICIVTSYFIFPIVIRNSLAAPFINRIIITILLIAPTSFLMGIPFPAGLKLAGSRMINLVPWAWGANGGASVLGSIVAILAAMNLGFTAVLFLAALSYIFALILFLKWQFAS